MSEEYEKIEENFYLDVYEEIEPLLIDNEDDEFHLNLEHQIKKTIYIRIIKDIYDADESKMIAFLKILVFNTEYANEEEIFYMADTDADSSSGISGIFNSEQYKDCLGLNDSCDYIGYITTLYVEPDYRRRGISTMLLSNIDEILLGYFGYYLSMVSISPSLNYLQIDNNMVHFLGSKEKPYSEKDKELYNAMIKNLEKNGFKKVFENEYLQSPVYIRCYD